MIAIDPPEELDARPFKPVTADATRNRGPFGIQIGLQKAVGKVAHRKPRGIDMTPHGLSVRADDQRADQAVSPPPHPYQLGTRISPALRLVERHGVIERKSLIATQNEGVGMTQGKPPGLQLRQRIGKVARVQFLATQAFLGGILVNAGGLGQMRNARRVKQRATRLRAGGENQSGHWPSAATRSLT